MSINQLQSALLPYKTKLVENELYSQVNSIEDVRVFMQHHVFAVWDFMSLVKYLQQQLTCVQVPWVPVGNPEIRFLINEIVLGEESDVDQQGNRISHFELYVKSMDEIGADTSTIRHFLNELKMGASVHEALVTARVTQTVSDFVEQTFRYIEEGKLHVVAGVFAFGREDLIPDMFRSMINEWNENGALDSFRYYLERHIEVDGGHHSHLAYQMVQDLCGTDELKWHEVAEAVKQALHSRLNLWEGINAELSQLSFS